LLRLHARRPHLFFAEAQETADLVAELRQGTILFKGQILHQLYRNTILIDLPFPTPAIWLMEERPRDTMDAIQKFP